MGVMRVDHPDIERFIMAKQPDSLTQMLWDAVGSMDHGNKFALVEALQKTLKLTNFNLSVAITDEFMECLYTGSPFALRFGGRVYREIDAAALNESIMRANWDWGEPGVLFIDTINKMNNLSYCETIAATNPCVHGDTLISTTIGDIPIRDLTKYKKIDVYARDECNNICIKPATFFRTKTKAKIVSVVTTKGTVKCTPDHKFLVGSNWVMASRLAKGDRIKFLNRRKHNETHLAVGVSGGRYVSESRLVAEYYYGNLSGKDVHHIDGNQYNNSILNLQSLPKWMHSMISNIGHEFYGARDTKTGRNTASENKKRKKKNANQGEVGLNCYVIDVVDDGECAPVFDGCVHEVHNYIANGHVVHNCGEQPLPPYGSCLLGSFNLPKYISKNPSGEYYFEWDQFIDDIPIAVSALDNVIDRAIYPLAKHKEESTTKRRMGLGITGLANAGEALGFPYGSKEFLMFESRVLDLLRDTSYMASSMIAKKKGAFPLYIRNKYLAAPFIKTLRPDVIESIRVNGIRNSHLTSIAPTGTISLCADNVSSGIEPVSFYHADRKINLNGTEQIEKTVDYGFGTLGVAGKVCADVSVDEHLDVLFSAAHRVDSAVSKTCNIGGQISWDDFKGIYYRAWSGGAKGCTTYRSEGKRSGILTASTAEPAAQCKIDPATGRKDCD